MKIPACLAIAAWLLAGCTASPYEQPSQDHVYHRENGDDRAPLTEAEALRIARDEAVRRGLDLAAFAEPVATRNGRTWTVFFDGKGPPPPCLGCHFTITVDERDHRTFYSPGR